MTQYRKVRELIAVATNPVDAALGMNESNRRGHSYDVVGAPCVNYGLVPRAGVAANPAAKIDATLARLK
jgi:hypothetical protein